MSKKENEVIDYETGEITSNSTAVAPLASMPIAELKAHLKLKRRVTIPILKQRVGVPIAFIFLTPMFLGRSVEGTKIKERPTMALVQNCQDNEVYYLILTTVEKSEILKAYPKQSYVNKGFLVELISAGEDKNYHIANIQEFEIDDVKIRTDNIEIPEGGEIIA